MGKLWIVLVNKTPRGPLTAEEIQALLQEKIVVRTDLALVVDPDNLTAKSDWKFLWQYEEFDLRAKSRAEISVAHNLRSPASSEQLKKKRAELLPEELALISPEDLVLVSTSKKNLSSSSETQSNEEFERKENASPFREDHTNATRFFYAAMAIVVLVSGVTFKTWLGNNLSLSRLWLSPDLFRVPAQQKESTAVLSNKIPTAQPKASSVSEAEPSSEKPSSEVDLPKKRIITLEEYQKMKAAEAEHDDSQAQRSEEENLEQEREANRDSATESANSGGNSYSESESENKVAQDNASEEDEGNQGSHFKRKPASSKNPLKKQKAFNDNQQIDGENPNPNESSEDTRQGESNGENLNDKKENETFQ